MEFCNETEHSDKKKKGEFLGGGATSRSLPLRHCPIDSKPIANYCESFRIRIFRVYTLYDKYVRVKIWINFIICVVFVCVCLCSRRRWSRHRKKKKLFFASLIDPTGFSRLSSRILRLNQSGVVDCPRKLDCFLRFFFFHHYCFVLLFFGN